MRFLKFLAVWFFLTLASLYTYHGHLRDARLQDFEIHRALYQEFYQIRKFPAYAALSQAVFSAKRYVEDRDALLKAESLSPLTMSLCDEALEAQRHSRWLLSVFTWLTLLLTLIGFLAWLRLLFKAAVSFVRPRKSPEEDRLRPFAAMTAALLLLLIASRSFAAFVSRPPLEKLDYRESMSMALQMDQYYDHVFEGWIELTNQIYLFHQKEQGPERKLERIAQIENAVNVFADYLRDLQPVRSDWLGFDSGLLIGPSLAELGRFSGMLTALKKWVGESSEAGNESLILSWNQYAAAFDGYLAELIDRHHAITSQNVRDLFLPEARRQYQQMAGRKDFSEDILLVPGFHLYRHLGFLQDAE